MVTACELLTIYGTPFKTLLWAVSSDVFAVVSTQYLCSSVQAVSKMLSLYSFEVKATLLPFSDETEILTNYFY